MKCVTGLIAALAMPLAAQEYKIAIVGLVHSHVWGYLGRMAKGQTTPGGQTTPSGQTTPGGQTTAKLVGIAEPNRELLEQAKKDAGSSGAQFYEDYRKMLDETKPDIVWAFVENNRHLEIAEACAPRKIQIMFEKPLAATYREAVAINRLAQKHGVRVLTNYQMAWWPALYAAKSQVDSGAIGKAWRLHGIVGHGGPGSQGTRSKYFFEWLTDPVKNGAGALMDFGCYNALWSLWYLGKPETVYATVNKLRPETFPKVEDNSDILLQYKDGVGVFEASWDLPRGFQDLEVFGRGGSISMTQRRVELRKGRETTEVPLEALPPERADPVSYMVSAMKMDRPIEGIVALPINVDVVEIIEAAKQSVASGRAVRLPLKK